MQAIRQLAPTVAVLDFFMPGLNGLEVLANMSAERSVTRAVFLTATATDKQLLTAVARGAKGIVLKEMALDELVQCIRVVAEGREWLPPSLIDAAFKREAARQSVSSIWLNPLHAGNDRSSYLYRRVFRTKKCVVDLVFQKVP